MARAMWSTSPRLQGIPGSRKEAPDDLPGSWGEGRLKKIPLIEERRGDRHQQWSGSQLWGGRQFLNPMYEEGAASSLSAL